MKFLINRMVQIVIICTISCSFSFAQDSLKTVYLGEVIISSDTITDQDYQLTADQLLEANRKLNVAKRGNFAWEPVIDGFTDGQITVAIDGMRVFGGCTDKMDPATSYLEPVNLQKLQVLHAADAQQYGTSLGGAINAEMRYPTLGNPLSLGVQTAYSSNTNGTDTNVFLEKSYKKIGFRYSGAYRQHQSYTDGNGNLVPHTQYRKQNHTFTTLFQQNESTQWTGLFMFDEGRDIGYPALPMDVSSATAYMGNLGFKKKFNDSFFSTLTAKVYYNSITHIMDDTQRENVAMHMDMPGKSQTGGVWTTLEHTSSKHQFKLKGDVYINTLFADMTMYSPTGGVNMYLQTWGDIQRNSAAIFIEDVWQLDPRLKWKNSLRLEAVSTNLTSDLARMQFEILGYSINGPESDLGGDFSSLFLYQLDKKWSASFGGSYTQRFGTASELYGFYLFNARDQYDYIGNPNLENEKATSFTFDLNYKKGVWNVGARARKTYIKDYIVGIVDENLDAMTPGALGVKEYQNVDNAQSSHFELYGSTKFTNWLGYRLSAVVENGYIDALHSPMPYMRPFTLKQDVRVLIKKVTIGGQYEYSSGMSSPSTILGEAETSSYHLVNLYVDYNLPLRKGNLQFDIAINNVFNTYYIDPFAWNSIPNMGRNIKAGINYKF
ncbi:TonB-dependent receptor plug domain-containing protein [Flammeovirga kamogawensis]|uniref:TonB-dependent receptor n=1 Tax=Flammeovirga kamogawensis TaxID=373891 RepID=A0ABX8H3Z7_9BACT|nr:TonB-dependent receptor [Flammeovirga kamogawensis]MBB6460244.1 iron complex outermembrane receptor protein [Flammeovirga kamogawensis]QWG10057.1 TonB-dependent receptor [Flammeovirga kamogawensis]TRX65564.1 TonB-dependent receptor [Flammeovirga kamogawensis]